MLTVWHVNVVRQLKLRERERGRELHITNIEKYKAEGLNRQQTQPKCVRAGWAEGRDGSAGQAVAGFPLLLSPLSPSQ